MISYVNTTSNISYADWESSPPATATVDEDSGYVTGIWEGESTITATHPNATNTVSYTLKVLAIPDGIYYLRNREYGKYLQINETDYESPGSTAEQWEYNAGIYQQWQITSLDNGYYSITSVLSGLALSVPAGQTATEDVTLIQQAYAGYDRQQWKITQTTAYNYIIRPKSADGLSVDLVMAAGDFDYITTYDANIEQRVYTNDTDYGDIWQICSFVDIGMSTDDYTGSGSRERGSYHYADTFYSGLTGIPTSKVHNYNKGSTYNATKNDFAVNGAISDDIDFMIYIGHGHSVDTGADDRFNDKKLNHIQYSRSTKGEINSSSVCTKAHDQSYKDRFCLYTDQVNFGSTDSDLRWVWMYTCNFLHAKEDNEDPDGSTINDNDYVTNAMLAEMMTGAHIVMGYSSASFLCEDVASGFATHLREGMSFYDAFFLYGHNYESRHASDNHHQKIMYLSQFEHETIYSPQIHYEYDSSDVVIESRGIDEPYNMNNVGGEL